MQLTRARAAQDSEGRAYLTDRLQAVAAGDRTALRDVYERTSAKLFGICLRILQEREEAADVLQDVYFTVWSKAERFDPSRASPITWLCTIARNKAIDRYRQIGPRSLERSIEYAGELADGTPNALDAMLLADASRRLRDCLEALDERTNRAIVEAFYGGVTYQELADRSEMPLGTMKSIIRRGLIRLKGCLSE